MTSSLTPPFLPDVIALEEKLEVPLYRKRSFALAHGQGARVWDIDGNSYIDCISGHGVAVVGHCHPQVVQAITYQAQELITCQESFANPARALFLSRLSQVMPPELSRFFLCNSGTEAVEAALKFARVATDRTEIIAATRAFHGRTMGALSATWRPQYRDAFQPLVPGFSHVPFNNIEALEKAVGENTAAVILEPVQGEGGVYPADPGYLKQVKEITHSQGALLILDEVQTGCGRTGHFLAAEHYQITPDIVCLAKGIGGGLPLGVVAVSEKIAAALAPGLHASTFGGNPLACAAGAAVLQIIEQEQLSPRAAHLGTWFVEEIKKLALPAVRDIRSLGLMIGLELRFRCAPYLTALEQQRVLALAAGPQVVRLLPPLVITQEELEQVLAALAIVLGEQK